MVIGFYAKKENIYYKLMDIFILKSYKIKGNRSSPLWKTWIEQSFSNKISPNPSLPGGGLNGYNKSELACEQLS